MQRSCLVGLVLAAALLLAASLALRRYVINPAPSPANQAVDKAAPPLSATVAATEGGATEEPPPAPTAPILAEHRVYEQRIEGLYLETVQPLAEVEMQVRGLAAVEGALYATAHDPAAQAAWLHQVDRTSGAVARSLPLHEQGPGEPCGLQATDSMLWTCLSTDRDALLLGLARDSWEIVLRAPFTDTLGVIAQTDDGLLVGADRWGRWFYRWDSEGVLLETATNAPGIAYSDCEVIRGSLVCSGANEDGAVLDVLDPASFSLLARHRATTRTVWGAWVGGNGLAHDGAWFLLAPAGGEFPLLWTYRLDGGALADYVPSTHPPR